MIKGTNLICLELLWTVFQFTFINFISFTSWWTGPPTKAREPGHNCIIHWWLSLPRQLQTKASDESKSKTCQPKPSETHYFIRVILNNKKLNHWTFISYKLYMFNVESMPQELILYSFGYFSISTLPLTYKIGN